jgi:hypothetical protein
MENATQCTEVHIKRGIKWNKNMYSDTQMSNFRQTILLQAHLLPPSACANTHSSHTPGYQMTHAHKLHKVVNRLCLTVDRDDLTEGTLPSAHCTSTPLWLYRLFPIPHNLHPLWG